MQTIRIIRIAQPLGSTVWFLCTDPAVLIDTGRKSHASALLDCLEQHAPLHTLRYILLTHAHPDHSCVAEFLRTATGASLLSLAPVFDRKFTHEHRATLQFPVAVPKPDRILHDRESIALGEETLDTLHTPGHADDHACFFLQKSRILFSGDLVINGEPGFLNLNKHWTESFDELKESMARIAALNATRIFPAHGQVIDVPQKMFKRVDAHLRMFRRNLSLVVAHTIIAPLIFFIASRESATVGECTEYIVRHRYLFDDFMEHVSADFLASGLERLLTVLIWREVLKRDGDNICLAASNDSLSCDSFYADATDIQACT